MNHLYEIYLLIFADLKKHLFNYQFYSTAHAVTNYTIKSWKTCQEYLTDYPEKRNELSNYLKEESKRNVFRQFTVLKDFKPSTIKSFLEDEDGDFLFCINDITNQPLMTGYHTSTILAFFAWLRSKDLIKNA